MAKQQVRTSKLVDPGGHFSQAVAVQAKGVMVFISGMTARRPDGGIAGIGDSERVNRVRREFFPAPAPASMVVEVSKLASPEFLVAISAIAVIAPSVSP
jgi:2-iminobutanoate/2-iminopropanoate deaminase